MFHFLIHQCAMLGYKLPPVCSSGAHVSLSAVVFLKLREIANISYYANLIIESVKRLMVSDVNQHLYFMSDLA